MPQNFLSCEREQVLLMPPSLRDWLPEDHLPWFVLASVEQLDLAAFYRSYRAHVERAITVTRSSTGAEPRPVRVWRTQDAPLPRPQRSLHPPLQRALREEHPSLAPDTPRSAL